MEANTIELLKECNKGCKMAIESMNQVIGKIKDEEMKNTVSECCEKHKQIEENTSELIKNYGEEESNPNPAVSMFSWLSTEVKTTFYDDDKKIAKIMMDGCNMGIQSVSEYMNKYKNASSDAKSNAKKLIQTEEKFMKEMEKYL